MQKGRTKKGDTVCKMHGNTCERKGNVQQRHKKYQTHTHTHMAICLSTTTTTTTTQRLLRIQFGHEAIYVNVRGRAAKAWVCGRSLARITGSNAAGGMDVYLL
jgi:microcystin-dependent protein